MNVNFVENVNKDKDNRVEFLFINFDFFDGNDLIAKILREECGVDVGEKVDGMFYSIIPLYYKQNEYKMMWHEDVGNYIYSENQEQEAIKTMREIVGIAVNELNRRISERD